MATCPYCRGSVDEELGRFGGPCPHCFNEIPGEEAATDPGVEAQQAEAQAQEAESGRKRSRVLILVGLIAVTVAVAATAFAVQKSRESAQVAEVLMYEDEVEFFTMSAGEIAAVTPEEQTPSGEAVASAGTKAGTGAKPAGTTTPNTRANPEPTSSRRNGGDAFAEDAAATTGSKGPGTEVASMGVGDVTIGGGLGGAPKGQALSDPAAMQAMAKRVMKANAGQIKSCYEQELKKDDGLRGAWIVSFTVNTDGSVSKPNAYGKNGANAPMEACIERAVGNWTFQPIGFEMPIKKTYRFGAGY